MSTALLLLLAGAIWDTYGVYQASSRLRQEALHWPTQQLAAQLNKDIDRVVNCQKLDSTPVDAQCLIDAAHQVTTNLGAEVVAGISLTWLQRYGQNAELRDAALGAIQVGRADLVKIRPLLDALDAEQAAEFGSVIGRLRGAGAPGHYFYDRVKRLDHIELALESPDRERKQQEWLREILVSSK